MATLKLSLSTGSATLILPPDGSVSLSIPQTGSITMLAGTAVGQDILGTLAGGTTDQVLRKVSNTDYDTEWHTLVKADVGLSNVDNTSDVNKPVSTLQAAAIAVVQADINAHEANTSNPHSVTQTQVGLPNVDNTSDLNKPISTATQTALNLKANLASPALTGNPTAPTQAALDNSTKIATTAYVDTAVTGATIPDATTLVKGKVQLAGDLAGTAALPTVPGLALKANIASPTFTGNPAAPTQAPLDNSTKLATTAYADAAGAAGTPDATTLIKGKLQLAGDLAGTAALPTVPRLPLPYYTEGEIVPSGNNIGTAFDMEADASWSSNAKIFLDDAASSGQGILLGTPTDNFRLEIVNLGPQTLNIYPQSGHTIFRFGIEVTDEVMYIRGNETMVITGMNSTTWDVENAGVDLSKENVFGLLPITHGGTGTVDGSGLPYLSKFGNSGDPAMGTYLFDLLAFGSYQIYDSNNPFLEGFQFLTSTASTDYFEMQNISGGGRIVGIDSNNLLVYFGGTTGSSDGLAWDTGNNRLQSFSAVLFGNWEFDGGDILQNPDGILTAAQLKYFDSSVFDINVTGINFMNSNVNIASIANGGNLGVGASASATRKIWSQSTSDPQLTLAYNNSTAYVDMTTASTSGLTFRPASNTTSGFVWKNAAGTTDILSINTTNTEINMNIGANTMGFLRGGSNITPTFVIGASGGKAVALLAGSSGSSFQYDSTGTFAIATEARATMVAGTSSGGTQRIGMTSAGLVMIGSGTAATNFHVAMDVATMPTIATASTGLIVSNASATGDSTSMSIIAGATGYSTINFGDTADENVGYIQYGHTANEYTFGVNTNPGMYLSNTGFGVGVSASERMTIGSSVNGTNIVLGIRTLTSGGSSMRTIMTQNASTGVLDWLVDGGGNGSARGFNLTLSAVTALAINSTGALTITAGQSIGSSSAKNIFNASTATTVVDFDINASSTANNTFFRLGNGTMSTASSGVTKILSTNPTVNQSGTAGYTALAVNVVETGTGSGAKNLTIMSIGGVEKFSIDNGGIVKASAQIRLKGYTVATLPAGTQGDSVFCSDLLAPTYLTAAVGGGAVVGPVFYNGAAWVCG